MPVGEGKGEGNGLALLLGGRARKKESSLGPHLLGLKEGFSGWSLSFASGMIDRNFLSSGQALTHNVYRKTHRGRGHNQDANFIKISPGS